MGIFMGKYRGLVAIITLLLFFLSGWQYLLLRKNIDESMSRIEAIHQKYSNIRWELIRDIINNSTYIAKTVSDRTSHKIIEDVYDTYPDITVLKFKWDNDKNNLDPEFSELIEDNIRTQYLFDIHNNRNGIIVCNYEGALFFLFTNELTPNSHSSWDNIINKSFNKALTENAIQCIKTRNTDSIVFWEIQPPIVDNHILLTRPSMDGLKEVFMKEGLNGLYNYTFLVPSYITDTGDIFGTRDFKPNGERQENHKLIIIQKFNVFDIVKSQYKNTWEQLQIEEDESVNKYQRDIRTNSWNTILSIFFYLILISLGFILNKKINDEYFKRPK